MVRKIQTAIVLEPRTKQMVDLKGINLSRFVEDALQVIFETSAAESVRMKIEDLDLQRAGLVSQLKQLEEIEANGLSSGLVESATLADLRERYREIYVSSDGHFNETEWITRPKILEMVKTLKKSKAVVLIELHDWIGKEVLGHGKKK
jgi:hypothetical protein